MDIEPYLNIPLDQPPVPGAVTPASLAPVASPSRYESQKRRDWNTFNQYLRNHRPPLSLHHCSGAHVIEFLKYLDQFGKTKVHVTAACPFYGLPNPPAPCPCPLKQAWGSLDALVGRLRAAYEENGGTPEMNPFGVRAVRMYLKEVRDSQSRARGVSYDKKKKKKNKKQQQKGKEGLGFANPSFDDIEGCSAQGSGYANYVGMETESAAVGKYDKDCGIGKCLLGRQVANYDEGLEMYKAHAHALGFSVRRGVTRKRPKTNELYEFYFYCSCEGLAQKEKPWAKKDSPVVRLPDLIIKEGESSEIKKKRKRRTVNITRFGCEALIRFKLDLESGFFVVVWHKVCHNHELAKANETHHLKSNRGINEDVGEVIRSMSNAGIKPMDSYNYLCLEVGGEELVGHTKKDHLNYINKMHMLDVEGGDMQSVLDMLDGKSSADNSFFYRVKVDDENHISCLFWRDSMMLEDFKVFGDLLITDTTHRTNKYNLICVPFVGINNHWLTTMFGCAFVTNEKSETFTWLLDAFKKSMHGIEPKTIFTDQDAALSNAIEKVFPRSNHRLCLWHLQRNFVSHFENLKSDDSFKKKFDKCLMGCDGAKEFEKNWHEMVEKYGLKKREWFDRLYELRKKWCPALSRDMFSAGILSTQRVEGANHAISFKSNVTTSLYEFFQIFEQVVKRWRSKEVEENFKNRMEKPHSIFRAHPLLKHAAEVYTLRLFNDFNMEFDQALSSYIRADGVQGEFQFFEVSMESDYNRSHRVLCQLESEVFYCDCLCFNETKLLCYHILRIMHMHNVFNIPKMYIEKRWTKDAKLDVCLGINAEGEVEKGESSIIAWRHTMARNYYSLLMEYHSIPEARIKCEENLVQLAKELKEIGKKEGKEVASVSNSSTCASTAKDDKECSTNDGIKDPVRRTAIKGRPKKPNIRIKGHFEKRKTTTSRPNEYGTMTPNQRLI